MNQSYQGKITTSIKYVVIAMSMMVAVSTSGGCRQKANW